MVLYGYENFIRRAMGIDRAVITRNTEGATRPGRPPAHSPRSILGAFSGNYEAARGGILPKCFPSLSDLPRVMAAILAKNRHI